MASERVEVITRTERRRRWSPADKLRLVLATREPGATVALVAREHGVSESLLYAWRGRLPPSRVNSAGATAAGGFVPITVVENRPVATVDPGAGFVPLPSATIEIELPNDAVLAKLSLLPKTEQDAICDILAILIDIDAPRLSLSPAQIASLRITLKELDAEKAGNAPEYPTARPKKRLRKAQARGNRSRID